MHSVPALRSGGRVNAEGAKRTMDKGETAISSGAFRGALCALMNLNEVAAFLTGARYPLFTPVIIGLLMAFVLSVPIQGIAGRLTRPSAKGKGKTH